jgi:hypothetical protein
LIRSRSAKLAPPVSTLLISLLAAALAGCGGGADSASPLSSAEANNLSATAPVAEASSAEASSAEASSADASSAVVATEDALPGEATPAFHMAAAVLDEPDGADAGGTNASATMAPRRFDVDASVADVQTARLTPQALEQHLTDNRSQAASVSASERAATPAPAAVTLSGAVFTPAQIRAAYGLPALPAVGATLSAAMAASLGAGQTIYALDAHHDVSALSDLNTFSTHFGLPSCTNVTVATTASLPLAKPGASCTFAKVYATSSGTMTTKAPTYDAGWAPESKLDVQWAHAIAPLARIVLIETPDAMTNNLLGGIALAGRLGPGVVTMSFGMPEASWAATVDSRFTAAGMTYVAASGDSGAQVNWPAVSPHVLAVGGTGLQWRGSGIRYEQAWLHSGGGVSAFEALPSWQSGVRTSHGALSRRAVPDVSFNANPLTGQYVALTAPGSTTTKWNSYGGTSIAAPQWAGIIAVANARRAAASKAPLGDVHASLYASIAAVPGTYAAAMSDIVTGSNGSCTICTAAIGFDGATGWGTPDTAGLMNALVGGTTTTTPPSAGNHAPTLASATIALHAGPTFTTKLAGKDADGDALTYAMTGAPKGVTLSTAGQLSWWSNPIRGTYRITVKVTDKHGASGSGVITLAVS